MEAERAERERKAREEAERKAAEEARRKAEEERLRQEQAEAAGEGEGEEAGEKQEEKEGEEGKETQEEAKEEDEDEGATAEAEAKSSDSIELQPSAEDLALDAAPDEVEFSLDNDMPPNTPETEDFKNLRTNYDRDFPQLLSVLKGTNNIDPIMMSVEKEIDTLKKDVIRRVEGMNTQKYQMFAYSNFGIVLDKKIQAKYSNAKRKRKLVKRRMIVDNS